MRKILAATALAVLWTGAALAQTMPDGPAASETTRTITVPGETVTKTRHTIDNRGVETNASESTARSGSITSGNGELSSKTTVETHQGSSVTLPPTSVTKSTATSTTVEVSH